jgi:hypothetical protein
MRDKKPVGIITRPLADVVVVMPPLAISEKSMRYLCQGVLESLAGAGGIVEAKRREFSHAPSGNKERRS